MHSIIKICADHLRAFSNHHGVKLKSGHAHELVAAFFGYKSKAAMQADTLCSIENLVQARIFVLMPSLFINERRKCLEDLPSDLPDTYTLGEEIFAYLVSEGKISGRFFSTWEVLAEELMTEYLQKYGYLILPPNFRHNQWASDFFNKPLHEFKLKIEIIDNRVKLIVNNMYQGLGGVYFEKIDLSVSIKLKRVASHVGFSKADIHLADNSYQPERNSVAI